MRRIALDLRMLVEPPDGISRYSLELLRRLPTLMPDDDIFAVGDPIGVRGHVAAARVLRSRTTSISAAEQLELPWILRRGRVDLFHATLFVAPLLGRRPYVLTLHDMNYLELPQLYGRHRQLYFQTAVRLFAWRARAIVTVSEFSKREIERHLGISAERIEVVPNGVDERFRPMGEKAIAAVRQRWGLPQDFLLYVGSYAPHKNVPFLLRAFARIKDAPSLVLCGRNPESIRGEIARLGLHGRAFAIPGQGDDALPALYSGATAFIFPSLYEGFGLPPLEAMACGTPTIVSDAASLPEVTGGAALTFPVDDEDALGDRIREIIGSSGLRERLSQSGRARAAQFRWEACAARMAEIYRRAL